MFFQRIIVQMWAHFSLEYLLIGLANETGELLGAYKKFIRDVNMDAYNNMKLECGDVLWYLTRIGEKLDVTLQDIADLNIEKLKKRRGIS